MYLVLNFEKIHELKIEKMKKPYSFFALIAFFAIGSCTKERLCTCLDETGERVEMMEFNSVNKSASEKACKNFEDLGYTNCELD